MFHVQERELSFFSLFTDRVDNIRHGHVIFMIRDTYFQEENPSLQVRILVPRVPHKHYRAKNGKKQLPRIDLLFYLHVSSFHKLQPCTRLFKKTLFFFVVIWDTYPFISESKNDKTDQKRLSQTVKMV